MSADNWTDCPGCQSKKFKQLEDLKKLYGKISVEEYSEKLSNIKEVEDESTQETLREDYHIGIRNGKFTVTYRGSCELCGYVKVFKHEEQVP